MRFSILALAAATALAVSPAAYAQQDVVEEVKTGCAKELDTFCKQVTYGNGRILACLYAFGDKLSGSCEYALYDAAVQLERAVNALSYVANECLDDAEKLCPKVQLGEGRVIECLKKNSKKIDSRCTQALKTTGL